MCRIGKHGVFTDLAGEGEGRTADPVGLLLQSGLCFHLFKKIFLMWQKKYFVIVISLV